MPSLNVTNEIRRILDFILTEKDAMNATCYTKDLVNKPKVCAVSFLNTVPLVWGMMHGPERELFEL